MLTALVALVAAVAPVRLAAPEPALVNVDPKLGRFLGEHFAQQLERAGLSVVTSAQIATILGVERQKQLLGCDEGNSCIAELAGALGSDGIVSGTIARVEDSFQVNLSILAASDGKALATVSLRVVGQKALLDALEREAPRVADEVFAKLRPGHSLLPPRPGARQYAWAPFLAGAALLVAGGGLELSAWSDSDRLQQATAAAPLSLSEAQATAAAGEAKQVAAMVAAGVGGAAVLAGVLMVVLGGDSPPPVAVVPLPGGAAVAFSGRLP